MASRSVGLLALVLLLGVVPARAATPDNVTYRGTLTDNGAPAPSGNYQMRFRLYDAPSGGTLLSEVAAHTVTVTNGTFTDDIGALFDVSHASGWLQVSVQAPTGGAFDDLPRVALGAVPYAVRASHADVADQAQSVLWSNVQGAPTPLQGPPGQSVVPMTLSPGHPVCAQGGSSFSVGATTTYACNGAAGAQGAQGIQGVAGPQGTPGTNGTSTVGQSVGVGDANCPNGGSRFQTGAAITFACNGAPGSNGTNGQSVTTASLSAGHPVCANGGASFTVGGNTTYACHGATGATGAAGTNGTNGTSVTPTALPVGDANCPYGGSRFTVGAATTYACNGAPGTGTVLTAYSTGLATQALNGTCASYLASTGGSAMAATIVAPGPGRIVVTGYMSVQFNHAVNVADRVQLGIGETATECGSIYDRVYLDVPAGEPTNTSKEYTALVRRVYDVSVAGTRTFYLNGMALAGLATVDNMYWGSINAEFYPN